MTAVKRYSTNELPNNEQRSNYIKNSEVINSFEENALKELKQRMKFFLTVAENSENKSTEGWNHQYIDLTHTYMKNTR